METIELHNEDDWTAFVAENHDAIVEDYGSLENAHQIAREGGLIFGGGAAAEVFVSFVDD